MIFKLSKETIKTNSLLKPKNYKSHFIRMRNNSSKLYKSYDFQNINSNINFNKNEKKEINKKNIGCQTFYNNPYNIFSLDPYINNFILHKSKSTKDIDSWDSFLSKSSYEGLHRKFINSKFYHSNISKNVNISNIYLDKIKLRNTLFYNFNNNNKAQISKLSEAVKRNKYKIKDNMNFRKKNFIYLYKMLNDYDLGVDNNKPTPILQGYKINNFPIKKIYNDSFQKSFINKDIFNFKRNNKNNLTYKKLYRNRSEFKIFMSKS